jgi:hypothetical protein
VGGGRFFGHQGIAGVAVQADGRGRDEGPHVVVGLGQLAVQQSQSAQAAGHDVALALVGPLAVAHAGAGQVHNVVGVANGHIVNGAGAGGPAEAGVVAVFGGLPAQQRYFVAAVNQHFGKTGANQAGTTGNENFAGHAKRDGNNMQR